MLLPCFSRRTEKLKKGCRYSIEFAAQVITDKFLNHLPLERQKNMMAEVGLSIEVKQLWRVTTFIYDVMVHITRMILAEIKRDKLPVHIDESPWPVQDDDNGYMWVFSNRAGSYYLFEPTRSGKVPVETLKKFKGITLTDGFSGHKRLIKEEAQNKGIAVTMTYCWAHVRRQFYDILENYPQCAEIIGLIDQMSETEHGAKDFVELHCRRNLSSKIVIDMIHDWMRRELPHTLSSDYLAKAIGYTMKLWPGLTKFLEDPHIPLTNNQAERDLRHAVMGRKNFGGSKSIDGADQAACFYTIIETCKKMELNPRTFMVEMMKRSWREEKLLTPLQYAIEIRPSPT